jgi:hypothetical protein
VTELAGAEQWVERAAPPYKSVFAETERAVFLKGGVHNRHENGAATQT